MTNTELLQKEHPAQTRMDTLLLVRVIATFAVVFGHAASFYGGFTAPQWPQFPYIQNIAVTVFFCMSGYTIAWVIDQMRAESFWRFLFDRVTRLSIPLLPTLIFFGVVEYAFYGAEHPYAGNFNLRSFLGNLLFLQDLHLSLPWRTYDLAVRPFGLNRPLWTVGMEFWIYTGFGGFAFAAMVTARKNMVLPLIAAICAVSLLMSVLYKAQGAGLPLIWGLGALSYFCLRKSAPLTVTAKLALLPIWGVFGYSLFQHEAWPPEGGFSTTYNLLIFANFFLFVTILSGLPLPRLINIASIFFGKFAYTVYLVHYPFILIFQKTNIMPQGEISSILAAIASIAFAWVFSLPFEQQYRPIRTWLWTLLTRRQPAQP